MAEGDESRTEPATPRRLQRAREAGQVALSREVSLALTLAVAAGLVETVLPGLCRDTAAALAAIMSRADSLSATQAFALAGRAGLPVAAVVTAAMAATGVLAVMGQIGFFARVAAVAPDFSRISPKSGISRVISVAALGRVGGAIAKFALLSVAVGWAWRGGGRWPWAAGRPEDAGFLAADLLTLTLRTLLAVLLVQGVIAAADLFRVRRRHAAQTRMSRQELRDEARDADGDPRIKARIRRLRMQRARQRMMAAVPTATLIVTNPTHYAIALAYTRGGGGAPKVVAKGVDAMAALIREAGATARVPMIANPPLARALYKVELDAEIPADLFAAVAELIALVWRMQTPRALPGPVA